MKKKTSVKDNLVDIPYIPRPDGMSKTPAFGANPTKQTKKKKAKKKK